MLIFRKVFWNRHHPGYHYIHIFSILAADFRTSSSHKITLPLHLTYGEVIVQMCFCPVDILVLCLDTWETPHSFIMEADVGELPN